MLTIQRRQENIVGRFRIILIMKSTTSKVKDLKSFIFILYFPLLNSYQVPLAFSKFKSSNKLSRNAKKRNDTNIWQQVTPKEKMLQTNSPSYDKIKSNPSQLVPFNSQFITRKNQNNDSILKTPWYPLIIGKKINRKENTDNDAFSFSQLKK